MIRNIPCKCVPVTLHLGCVVEWYFYTDMGAAVHFPLYGE